LWVTNTGKGKATDSAEERKSIIKNEEPIMRTSKVNHNGPSKHLLYFNFFNVIYYKLI